jgi:hypothetical protein
MRIGTLVSKEDLDSEFRPFVPDGSPVGMVIGVDLGERDGHDYVKSAIVRWPDGRIELFKPGYEDSDLWLLADVTPLCYANLYLWDRAYGGPEEGGWFYDTYTPVASDDDWETGPPPSGHFPSPEAVEAAREKLEEWCEAENANRQHPNSCISDGHFCVKLEPWPAEFHPIRRPYYC